MPSRDAEFEQARRNLANAKRLVGRVVRGTSKGLSGVRVIGVVTRVEPFHLYMDRTDPQPSNRSANTAQALRSVISYTEVSGRTDARYYDTMTWEVAK